MTHLIDVFACSLLNVHYRVRHLRGYPVMGLNYFLDACGDLRFVADFDAYEEFLQSLCGLGHCFESTAFLALYFYGSRVCVLTE